MAEKGLLASTRVAIFGLGLMGGSLAMGLRGKCAGLLGIDPDDVLADTDLLTLILNYHISPGYRDSGSVLSSKKVRMRDGGFLLQDSGLLTDNLDRNAAIIATDIEARNGIVHVIDNVVLPALP